MIRAFVAVDLSEPLRVAIGEVQARMKRAHLGVKVSWVKIENIHLTLHFLGYVPEDMIPRLSEALERVSAAFDAFDVVVRGVGAFPSAQRPRVLWVGCGDEETRLTMLARAVQWAMKEFGFEPERREFAAHLTLGRIKWPRPDAALTKLLDSLRDCDCGTLRVDAVHLFESQLHPQGSIYTRLSSHTLKGATHHASES